MTGKWLETGKEVRAGGRAWKEGKQIRGNHEIVIKAKQMCLVARPPYPRET